MNSGSTMVVEAPVRQVGDRSNTSGMARISNVASRECPAGNCTPNVVSAPLALEQPPHELLHGRRIPPHRTAPTQNDPTRAIDDPCRRDRREAKDRRCR